MPPFKDEHVLMIAPGSKTTLAQLGLPESFTPARLRIPSRMFPAEKEGEWEAVKIREKKRPAKANLPAENGVATGDRDGDVSMGEPDSTEAHTKSEGDRVKAETSKGDAVDTEPEYEEDPESDEGAVYPLKNGRVTNWSCFLALLNHVHDTLSPPFHTPILVIAQPTWTAQDRETVTQFFFEKFKTPAFCLMDAALAVCYAYGVSTATVIDVGFEKADVTAINDFVVHEVGRTVALPHAGGEAMTDRLFELLEPKGWTRDMCDQLKTSNICEILPKDVPIPGDSSTSNRIQSATNPAAAASTGATGSAPGEGSGISGPRGPGLNTAVGTVDDDDDADPDLKEVEDNDGVLDVATIVASGKTQEYLAKKEREKAERAAKKASDAAAAAAASSSRPTRLPNAKRVTNTFVYEDRSRRLAAGQSDVEPNGDAPLAADTEPESAVASDAPALEPAPITAENPPPSTTANLEEPISAIEAPSQSTNSADPNAPPRLSRKEQNRRAREAASGENVENDPSKREVEVGPERFLAASGGILESIADAVHRTVLRVEEVNKRAELWDGLIVVGNGARVKGFKDALLSTLTQRYLISPSSATIFTSELPSNLSTPLATGANTPTPGQGPSASSVIGGMGGPSGGGNPLLLAATTASAAALKEPPSTPQRHDSSSGQHSASTHNAHSSHGQTPTNLKLLKPPEYFPEWKESGFDEAAFLGAQVAAKVVFVVDQGLSKGFMTRVEYNEVGPGGIHDCGL